MQKFALLIVTVFGLALSGAAFAGGGCNYGGGLKTTKGHSPVTPDTTTTSVPAPSPEKGKG